MTDCLAVLVAKRDELLSRLTGRGPLEFHRCSDPLDEACLVARCEAVAGEIRHDKGLLEQVAAAIKRIERGTYGMCAVCDEPIEEKRLEAVPWAERCRGCQEREEAEG